MEYVCRQVGRNDNENARSIKDLHGIPDHSKPFKDEKYRNIEVENNCRKH